MQEPLAKIPDSYPLLLDDIKDRIRKARVRAGLAVNAELVLLYWEIGNDILKRQAEEGWGAKVIDHLSLDLRTEFPDIGGLSLRNLKYMRKFAQLWQDEQIVQQLVALIPWGHNIMLIEKAAEFEERLWYAQKTMENGWSRNVLVHQIESGLYHRQGAAVTNFEAAIPILCKTKNRIIAEYALRGLEKPVGVASYKLVRRLPKELKTSLPTVKELKRELEKEG